MPVMLIQQVCSILDLEAQLRTILSLNSRSHHSQWASPIFRPPFLVVVSQSPTQLNSSMSAPDSNSKAATDSTRPSAETARQQLVTARAELASLHECMASLKADLASLNTHFRQEVQQMGAILTQRIQDEQRQAEERMKAEVERMVAAEEEAEAAKRRQQ